MDVLNEIYYRKFAKLSEDTQSIRTALADIYPDCDLVDQRIRAIKDGIITHEEAELLRLYITW